VYTYDGIGSHERTGYSCEVRPRMLTCVVCCSPPMELLDTGVIAAMVEDAAVRMYELGM